jgi:hypothetical protein
VPSVRVAPVLLHCTGEYGNPDACKPSAYSHARGRSATRTTAPTPSSRAAAAATPAPTPSPSTPAQHDQVYATYVLLWAFDVSVPVVLDLVFVLPYLDGVLWREYGAL